MTRRAGPILIAGAGGMLGRALSTLARQRSLNVAAFSREQLDVTDSLCVDAAVAETRPAAVLNLAGYTAVDRAESEPGAALKVNRDGAANLARAGAAVDARIFYVSTDYVFDGTQRAPYKPGDPTNPQSVYGRTKLLGENAVREAAHRHVVVRTSWVFAPWGTNFVRTIAARARDGRPLRVVADQTGCPTSATELAAGLLALVEAEDFAGTVHFSCRGETTWFGFAEAIIEEMGRREPLPPVDLTPVTTAEYGAAAARPAYSVLDTTSFSSVTGIQPRHWRDALRDALDNLE